MPIITEVIEELGAAQQADKDNRKASREADLFLNKRDGQWEPHIVQAWDTRPRYTFDQCNPVVDNIMADMSALDFAIKVTPTGGGATKDYAAYYGGIIRNLENISKANILYNTAARVMVGTGLDGWRVVHDWRDNDSMQQDLLIKHVRNFRDRVWFDVDSIEQDASDAKRCWVLTSMSLQKYLKRWPNGSKHSVSNDRDESAYWDRKPDEVIVGEFYELRPATRKLALLSNNQVVVVDDKFDKVRDELFAKRITVVRERERKVFHTYHAHFDGSDWLSSFKKTAFDTI